MDQFTQGHGLREPVRQDGTPGENPPEGVRGWLLALCLMLTIVGPALSAWLMTSEYAAFAPYFASFGGLRAAILVSIAITCAAIVFGIYAGYRLWSIRPGAVETAKYALLFGLAADVATALLQVVAGPTPTADGPLFNEVVFSLVPSLLFFVLAVAYLNGSSRVRATYRS